MSIFKKQFDICYSHLDSFRRVKLTALLDFLQDAATAHSDSLGMTLENMHKDGAFWVLISLDLTIHCLPMIDDRVTIETWSSAAKTVYGYREFRMLDQNGTLLLTASSVWVYMGWDTMRPVRIPAEKIALFAPLDTAPPKRKKSLPMPKNAQNTKNYRIMRRDIDTNNHVNNVRYAEFALETLDEPLYAAIPKQVELQFLHSASCGDHISIQMEASENSALCAIINQADKTPYALVCFTY